jgi:hypothetical protein
MTRCVRGNTGANNLEAEMKKSDICVYCDAVSPEETHCTWKAETRQGQRFIMGNFAELPKRPMFAFESKLMEDRARDAGLKISYCYV